MFLYFHELRFGIENEQEMVVFSGTRICLRVVVVEEQKKGHGQSGHVAKGDEGG